MPMLMVKSISISHLPARVIPQYPPWLFLSFKSIPSVVGFYVLCVLCDDSD